MMCIHDGNASLRIQWIKECLFDIVVHENVKEFPHEKMLAYLGPGCVFLFVCLFLCLSLLKVVVLVVSCYCSCCLF